MRSADWQYWGWQLNGRICDNKTNAFVPLSSSAVVQTGLCARLRIRYFKKDWNSSHIPFILQKLEWAMSLSEKTWSGNGRRNFPCSFLFRAATFVHFLQMVAAWCLFGEHPRLWNAIDENYFHADGTIRITVERTTCNLQCSIKRGMVTTQMHKFHVFQDVCKAPSYLHKVNDFHRDLKPQSMLLRIYDGNWVESSDSEAGKFWMLSTCQRSAAGRNIYYPNIGGGKYFVHSIWCDGDGELANVSNQTFLGCVGVRGRDLHGIFTFSVGKGIMPDTMSFWKSTEIVPRIQ